MVGFRNRADPEMNTSYAVLLLEMIAGELNSEPTEEIAQCGFYALSQIQEMPLSSFFSMRQKLRIQ
jgi:hypothetical protein